MLYLKKLLKERSFTQNVGKENEKRKEKSYQ